MGKPWALENEERHVPSAAYNSEEKTLKTTDDLRTRTYKGFF